MHTFDPAYVAVLVVIFSCVTFRITRFICADALPLVARPREWIIDKLGDDHWFSYLITCMWCASVYVATGVVLTVDFVFNFSVPMPAAMVVVASGVTGTIAMHEPDD